MTKRQFKLMIFRYLKKMKKNRHLFLSGLVFLFSMMTFVFLQQKKSSEDEWVTIDAVSKLVSFLKENPKMDNENIIKPDYATYFKQWKSGYFDTLLEFVGLKEKRPWHESQFITLLDRVTKQRQGLGFKDDTIVKVQLKEKSRLIVIGNLQGAFHSLVRDLEELIKMKILSKEFKLLQKADFLFCTGDAINRSPYSIETMSLLMRLLEENPDRFFYIQGNHEDNNYWKDYTLKQELKMKISGGSGDSIPLEKEVNAFFETLPLAWYGETYPSGSKKFLRISHEGLDYPKLQESKFKHFLMGNYDKEVSKFQVSNQNDVFMGDPSPLIGFIRAEKKRKTYQTMDGMRMLPPEEGIVGWTVLSCPTKIYQLGIKFFYDAFAIVQCQNQVADWTITLYNQDIRIKNGFALRTHNFLSGSLPGKTIISSSQAVQQKPLIKQLPQKKMPMAVQNQPEKKTESVIKEEKQISVVQPQVEKEQTPPVVASKPTVQVASVSQPKKQNKQPNQAANQQIKLASPTEQKASPVAVTKVIQKVPVQKNRQPIVKEIPIKDPQIKQKKDIKQPVMARVTLPMKATVKSAQGQKSVLPVQVTPAIDKPMKQADKALIKKEQKIIPSQKIAQQPIAQSTPIVATQVVKQENKNVQVKENRVDQQKEPVQKVVTKLETESDPNEISMVQQPGVHKKEKDDNLKEIVVKEIKEDEDEKKDEIIVENPAVLISREEIEPIPQPPIADALPVNPAEANVTANMSN